MSPTTKAQTRVPHDIEAEESLLGSMMLSRDAFDAIDGLDTADFHKPIHAHIFDAAMAVHARGEGVDTTTLIAELADRGQLDSVGGADEVRRIQAATSLSNNAAAYVRRSY